MNARYEPETGVSWVVSDDAIHLFRKRDNGVRSLTYPEAALWDLMTRHSDAGKLEQMLRLITGDDTAANAAWLEATLEDWLRADLIRAADRC